MGGCSWCGQLPRFGCWQEQLPGLWRAWHTWHPPPPRPRRPDLELAGACQLPDQNQYTRRLPKFQVQRSPHVRAVGRVRQMGNFWVDRHQLEWPPPFPAGGRLSARCRPPSLAASGAGPRNERPLVTSLTLQTLSATLSTIRTAIGREIRSLFVVSYAPRAAQERSLFPCRTTYFRLVIPPRGLLWFNDGLV